jgi:hypothetical protein
MAMAPMGMFDVTGIGGQFTYDTPADNGYEILPRFPSDFFDKVPNLVGDIEMALGNPGNWMNADEMTNLYDDDGDGVFTLTVEAQSDFASSANSDGSWTGYQVVKTAGSWDNQYPGAGKNVPIWFSAGDSVTFYYQPLADTTWFPNKNLVYDSQKWANMPTHTFTAVGGWQGWDPASTETLMRDDGQGGDEVAGDLIYTYWRGFAEDAGDQEFKVAMDGTWALQIGADGINNNAWTTHFNAQADHGYLFEVDAFHGCIRVVDMGPGTGTQPGQELPTVFALAQNFPNPFNPTTTINYQLPKAVSVQITVYNMLGQRVRTLVNTDQEAGYYNVVWNSTNDVGIQLASGVYFYSIKAGNFHQTRKLLLLK